MKKILLSCIALLAMFNVALAQESKEFYKIGNRWAIGAGAGTEGVSVDLSTNFSKYISARFGVNIVPGININEDFEITGEFAGHRVNSMLEAEGSLERTTFDAKVDIYPFPNSSSFFISAGCSWGGKDIIKIKGHSDEAALLISEASALGGYNNQFGIDIDDIRIPVDENGDASGGVKVKKFRPYFGLGFGRAVPKKRVGVRVELGLQLHDTPEIYADNSNVDLTEQIKKNTDNDIVEIIDKLNIYPVFKLSLRGRIF